MNTYYSLSCSNKIGTSFDCLRGQKFPIYFLLYKTKWIYKAFKKSIIARIVNILEKSINTSQTTFLKLVKLIMIFDWCSSCLTFWCWIIEVCPHKNLLLALRPPSFTRALTWPQQLPGTFPGHLLKVLHLLVPSLLALQDLLHSIFGPLAHTVLLFAYIDDLVSKFEGFSDNLSQSLFVELGFFC